MIVTRNTKFLASRPYCGSIPYSPMPPEPKNPNFPTTSWSLIRRVQCGSPAEAAKALEEVCRCYWYPVYAYARRYGLDVQDAEDITQDFFQNLVASDSLQVTSEEKGRLRSFMLAVLKRSLSKQLRRDYAAKRGGSRGATLSLDELDPESRYAAEPVDQADPEVLFDRTWAAEVLASAESKLRADFEKADNLDTFEAVQEFLPHGDNSTPYAAVATKLGITEGTVRLQIHRMRKRYAKLIEHEITQTVVDPSEVKSELEHLMTVVGR